MKILLFGVSDIGKTTLGSMTGNVDRIIQEFHLDAFMEKAGEYHEIQ